MGIKMWVSGAPGGKQKLTGSKCRRANIYNSLSRPFLVSILLHSCFHKQLVDTGGIHYTYELKCQENMLLAFFAAPSPPPTPFLPAGNIPLNEPCVAS